MDATLQGLRDMRQTISFQEEKMRNNREKIESDLDGLKDRVYQLDNRVSVLLKLLRGEYTDVVSQRFEAVEEKSLEIENQQLKEQKNQINSLSSDIQSLKGSVEMMKRGLEEVRKRDNSNIKERLAKLERIYEENETRETISKLKQSKLK